MLDEWMDVHNYKCDCGWCDNTITVRNGIAAGFGEHNILHHAYVSRQCPHMYYFIENAESELPVEEGANYRLFRKVPKFVGPGH